MTCIRNPSDFGSEPFSGNLYTRSSNEFTRDLHYFVSVSHDIFVFYINTYNTTIYDTYSRNRFPSYACTFARPFRLRVGCPTDVTRLMMSYMRTINGCLSNQLFEKIKHTNEIRLLALAFERNIFDFLKHYAGKATHVRVALLRNIFVDVSRDICFSWGW